MKTLFSLLFLFALVRLTAQEQEWGPSEHWVWKKIQAGQIADLYDFKGEPTGPKPRIRSTFIEDILANDSLSALVPITGIRILNAQFMGPLDLSNHIIDFPLWLDKSYFHSAVKMYQTTFSAYLSLDGSQFKKDVSLRYLESAGILNLDSVSGPYFDLTGSLIRGNLRLVGCRPGIDTLVLRNSKIEGATIIQNSAIQRLDAMKMVSEGSFEISLSKDIEDVDLNGARINQDLLIIELADFDSISLSNSTLDKLSLHNLKGSVILMNSVSIQNDCNVLSDTLALVFNQGEVKGNLNVSESFLTFLLLFQTEIQGHFNVLNTHIGGVNGFLMSSTSMFFDSTIFYSAASFGSSSFRELVGVGSCTFHKGLDMNGSKFGSNVLIRDDTICGELRLANITTAGDLRLDGSLLSTVVASGAEIGGSLWLFDERRGKPPTHWQKSDTITTFLDLNYASVGLIRDNETKWVDSLDVRRTWPDSLDLRGFTYEDIYFLDRESDWYIQWLDKSPYFKSSYDQLATILRAAGKRDAAKAVAIESGEKLKNLSAWYSGERIFLTFMWLVTEYGEKKNRILYILFAFVGIGMMVLHFSGERDKQKLGVGFLYSLDKILPIISLDKSLEGVHLQTGWVRNYFYFHQLLGYLLLTLLLASLADDLII